MPAVDRGHRVPGRAAHQIAPGIRRNQSLRLTVTAGNRTLPSSGDCASVRQHLVGNSPRPGRFDQGTSHRSGNTQATGRICADSHLVDPVPGCAEITHPPGELRGVYSQVRGIHGTRGGRRTALSRRDLERGGTPEHDVTHAQEASPPGFHGRRYGSRDGFAAGRCLGAGGPLTSAVHEFPQWSGYAWRSASGALHSPRHSSRTHTECTRTAAQPIWSRRPASTGRTSRP